MKVWLLTWQEYVENSEGYDSHTVVYLVVSETEQDARQVVYNDCKENTEWLDSNKTSCLSCDQLLEISAGTILHYSNEWYKMDNEDMEEEGLI